MFTSLHNTYYRKVSAAREAPSSPKGDSRYYGIGMPNDGDSRLDRIEAILEALATSQADLEDEFRRLLRAQVVMADSVRELAAETTRRFAATDDKLNALIDIVRKRPPQL